MARDEAPPFGRGETFYNGATIDANNLGGTNLEGKEWVFEDLDLSQQGIKPARTNRKVRCRCVRNVSGIALLPKRLARFKNANWGAQVDGYTTVDFAQFAGVVDEWLPAAGVPNNDLFWLVVEGPTVTLTDIAAAAGNVINQGDYVVALTAATSQATTAGRVQVQNITNATTDNDLDTANQVQNRLGNAMSAKTTANTNADLLTDLRPW